MPGRAKLQVALFLRHGVDCSASRHDLQGSSSSHWRGAGRGARGWWGNCVTSDGESTGFQTFLMTPTGVYNTCAYVC